MEEPVDLAIAPSGWSAVEILRRLVTEPLNQRSSDRCVFAYLFQTNKFPAEGTTFSSGVLRWKKKKQKKTKQPKWKTELWV